MSVFSSIVWECVWVKPKESLKHYSEASHWPAGGLSSIWAVGPQTYPLFFLHACASLFLEMSVTVKATGRKGCWLMHTHPQVCTCFMPNKIVAIGVCVCVCVYDKLHAKNSTDLQETTKQYKQIRTLLVRFLFTNSQMQLLRWVTWI